MNKNNFFIDFVVSADKKFDSKKEDMLDFKHKENADKWIGQITEEVYQAMYGYQVEIDD